MCKQMHQEAEEIVQVLSRGLEWGMGLLQHGLRWDNGKVDQRKGGS